VGALLGRLRPFEFLAAESVAIGDLLEKFRFSTHDVDCRDPSGEGGATKPAAVSAGLFFSTEMFGMAGPV
jgi:hypothetical protein